MRNFKKFLALLLATMMVLGGMVTVSAAEELEAEVETEVETEVEETEETEEVEEIDWDAQYEAVAAELEELGIVKGVGIDYVEGEPKTDYAVNELVVRWQFALFVARVMTGETSDSFWNVVSDNTTPFDDVDNYLGAINYICDQGVTTGMGFIPGVGFNCFGPDYAISYQDALTMAVRALGEKQLIYPQGFVKVAEAIGLADGLEEFTEADWEEQLTRGQMIQIIYNLLYATTDKKTTSFAEDVFGIKEPEVYVPTESEATYVLAATNYQYLPGTDRTLNPGAIELVKLNADGTYNFKDVIVVSAADLGLKDNTAAELKLGYSYKVSYEDDEIVGFEERPNETFQNFGKENEKNWEIKTTANKYNQDIVNGERITIDGKTYQLVEKYDDLDNETIIYNSTITQLVMHSFADVNDNSTNGVLWYDNWGNIIDTKSGTYQIALYRIAEGVYIYYDENKVAKIADEAKINEYRIYNTNSLDNSVMYEVVTSIGPKYFCEVTLFDDNADGEYDRGVYTPYMFGVYGTKAYGDTKIWSDSVSATAKKKTSAQINGVDLTAYVTDDGVNWEKVTEFDKEDIFFIDAEGEYFTPTAKDYVLYTYNPYSRIFMTKGVYTEQTGVVTGFSSGYPSADDITKRKGTWVEFDGVEYELGYYADSAEKAIAGSATALKGDLYTTRWDDILVAAYNYKNYYTVDYVAFDGAVIVLDASKRGDGWMVFDYGKGTEVKKNNSYTTWEYEGDIIGVDENGYIMVAAYVSDTTKTTAYIDTINGYNFGLLVEDYATLQYNFPTVGFLQNNQLLTMKQVVAAQFFEQLTADLDPYCDGEQTDCELADRADKKSCTVHEKHQLVFTVVEHSDGVYDIYTDVALYWGAANVDSYRQPEITKYYDDAVFDALGYSTTTIDTLKADGSAVNEGKGTRLKFDKNSVIVIAAADGIFTYTGKPEAGNKLTLTDDVAVLNLTANKIILASATKTHGELYKNGNTAVKADQEKGVNVGYTYFMVIGDESPKKADNNTSAEFYTYNQVKYNNLYNINEFKTETVLVEGGLDKFYTTDNTKVNIGNIYAYDEASKTYTLIFEKADEADFAKVLAKGTFTADNSEKYNGIYESADTIDGASSYAYYVDFTTKPLYDYIDFKYNRVNFVYTNGTKTLKNITVKSGISFVDTDAAAGKEVKDDITEDLTEGQIFYYTYNAEKVSFTAHTVKAVGKKVDLTDAQKITAGIAALKDYIEDEAAKYEDDMACDTAHATLGNHLAAQLAELIGKGDFGDDFATFDKYDKDVRAYWSKHLADMAKAVADAATSGVLTANKVVLNNLGTGSATGLIISVLNTETDKYEKLVEWTNLATNQTTTDGYEYAVTKSGTAEARVFTFVTKDATKTAVDTFEAGITYAITIDCNGEYYAIKGLTIAE